MITYFAKFAQSSQTNFVDRFVKLTNMFFENLHKNLKIPKYVSKNV